MTGSDGATERRGDEGVHRRTCNAGEAAATAAPPAALASELIQDDEIIILWMRPSVLFVPLSSLRSLALIAVAMFALAWMARSLAWVPWTDTQAFALGFGAAVMQLGWQVLDWYGRVYVLTDRRVIRRRGVLRVSVFQSTLRNIQHIIVHRRVRERLFGLGTIGFSTAGSDVFDALWEMVQDPFGVQKVVNEAVDRYGR